MAPKAFICGCSGLELTEPERAFLRAEQPWGLILFARNCGEPDQIRRLVASFRSIVGRADAPVLIDQEGGRIQRLKPPRWTAYPAAAAISELAAADPQAGRRMAWLCGRLIGEDLFELGITVDCAPVLDLRVAGAHDIVGDRSYGASADDIVPLAESVVDGLSAAGVAPVVKHIPGHGRALADSHLELPVVDASADTLAADFEPFRRMNQLPMAMTAHVVYSAFDPQEPATLSRRVIEEVIRGAIGFDGLVMTDDLSMRALSGGVGENAARALAAGCDIALHCNGDLGEMAEVAAACPPLAGKAAERAAAATAWAARKAADLAAARRELSALSARPEEV
ncbi:beta-N-acetylhexosaminidase [Tepidamorphus gemmatus]|uniref:beta-N-acetylhexosaminidase n=1 Tax=Tepidamorphus gemmatus TaxID=747076 RepID=A0A4R3MKP6_9HYPH|nr:beta-N-acetylhexosaminidase [Tepidamorphus gemmatus]TCT12410.1 beta-N-acetylhexosaminidase [Tepidamorphus gemmatus]